MLLAHSPVPVPMSPPSAHRRHPSAPPAVVVQPTKVPGILSVSKPLRAASPRQHNAHGHARHPHRSPKPRHPQPHNRSPQDGLPKSAQDKQPHDAALPPVAQKPPAHPPTPPLPDKSPRGRQTKAPKDKAAARSSSPHGPSRRNNLRQPSPPIHSSQVEGPISSSAQSFSHRISNPATNSFDPFLVSSDSDSDHNSRPPFPSSNGTAKLPPALAAPPSSKAARRRNHVSQPATPSPAPRPVPVPRGKQPHDRNNLSRSAPSSQVLPPLEKRRVSAAYATDFPVCDDTTDVEDTSPSTPTRGSPAGSTWQRLSLDGPRTAPLSSLNRFSFTGHADSTPSRIRHHHHRTPSEGVFNMSFDEDIFTASDASEEARKLLGLPPKRFRSVGPSATRVGKDVAGFFASSVFQNSPSPDELPPPAF